VKRALAFTLAVALVAALLATWAAGRFAWGAPEVSKAQCEALDAATLPPMVKDALARAYHARVAAAIVREPQNTWSNLAFVFSGALIVARDRRVFPRLLGAALVALGIASGLYHASLLPAWRTVDVATMGWVSFALVCVGGAAVSPRLAALRPAVQLALGGIGGALAMTAAVFRNDVRVAGVKPFDSTYTTIAGVAAVFVLLAGGVLIAARRRERVRPLLVRLGLLAVGVAAAAFCQLNDRPGRCLCAPDGVVQGHAAWHVLMAAAAALAQALFRRIEARP
jgi:hypothetical protein